MKLCGASPWSNCHFHSPRFPAASCTFHFFVQMFPIVHSSWGRCFEDYLSKRTAAFSLGLSHKQKDWKSSRETFLGQDPCWEVVSISSWNVARLLLYFQYIILFRGVFFFFNVGMVAMTVKTLLCKNKKDEMCILGSDILIRSFRGFTLFTLIIFTLLEAPVSYSNQKEKSTKFSFELFN